MRNGVDPEEPRFLFHRAGPPHRDLRTQHGPGFGGGQRRGIPGLRQRFQVPVYARRRQGQQIAADFIVEQLGQGVKLPERSSRSNSSAMIGAKYFPHGSPRSVQIRPRILTTAGPYFLRRRLGTGAGAARPGFRNSAVTRRRALVRDQPVDARR